jgi:hypothetical protein
MPYFTAASVVRFYVFRGIFFVGHTHCRAPVQKIMYTYRIVRLSFRRRPQGSLTVTLCCIHVVHLNTLRLTPLRCTIDGFISLRIFIHYTVLYGLFRCEFIL